MVTDASYWFLAALKLIRTKSRHRKVHLIVNATITVVFFGLVEESQVGW
jgi:hypothetical protein